MYLLINLLSSHRSSHQFTRLGNHQLNLPRYRHLFRQLNPLRCHLLRPLCNLLNNHRLVLLHSRRLNRLEGHPCSLVNSPLLYPLHSRQLFHPYNLLYFQVAAHLLSPLCNLHFIRRHSLLQSLLVNLHFIHRYNRLFNLLQNLLLSLLSSLQCSHLADLVISLLYNLLHNLPLVLLSSLHLNLLCYLLRSRLVSRRISRLITPPRNRLHCLL